MRIDMLTAFPGMIAGPFNESIIRLAHERDLVDIFIHDLRAFTTDRHKTIDAYAYGGGSGMVLKPEPIFRGVRFIRDQISSDRLSRCVLLSARGKPFLQETAKSFMELDQLILICGHYKGVDERIIHGLDAEEYSIGDFVVTGGELPAMMIADAVIRLIPGVLGDIESAVTDSFYEGLLDCPYYTRPEQYENWNVPEVLLSGHHERIERWRREESLKTTWQRRPELLRDVNLSKEDDGFLDILRQENNG
jgi:tRNA (guanine37-N1)-methyltransferase